MKNSIMTAREIYEEVHSLRKELVDIKNALDSVEDCMGEDNSAFKLLMKHKDDKFAELQKFESREFTHSLAMSSSIHSSGSGSTKLF